MLTTLGGDPRAVLKGGLERRRLAAMRNRVVVPGAEMPRGGWSQVPPGRQ